MTIFAIASANNNNNRSIHAFLGKRNRRLSSFVFGLKVEIKINHFIYLIYNEIVTTNTRECTLAGRCVQ